MTWRDYADWAKKRPLTLKLADRLGRGKGRLRWFDRIDPPPAAPGTPDLSRWNEQELAAAWIGHATVLLRVGDLTILTDPVMSNRIGVGLGLMTGGPRRFVAPALSIRKLPPIDLILVSHAHFDHLDRPTLMRLPKHVPVITASRTSDLIRDLGFETVTELRWGESIDVSSIVVTAQQVQHWGARTFYDRYRGFNAYLIEAGRRRILYGGDTAYHELFRSIGNVDLAIFGISAYNPYIQAHATPEQAWQMADHVRADFVLPMHHSTFRLSYEPMQEPMERMLAAAGNDEKRIIIRQVGDMWKAA
ncbi:MAG TPA: MBL fold metallo-hydrolase [Tepidisphaeraceae bacterium]|jgi:L-ascorbate metabolism protein UlaG (beta-lactamase superfamily)